MRFAHPHLRIPPVTLAVLLVAAVALVYSNSLQVPFLLDDHTTISDNPSIKGFAPSLVLFPPPNVYSAGRPVLNLTYALNHALGGTAVGGYHLFNILIHAFATLALFGVLRRTMMLPSLGPRFASASTPLAFVIAGLWALHPLQTVSVTYVSQRAESLMGLFYLLTLYCFVRGVLSSAGTWWKLASLLACTLGMATKEVMVTAPVLVFLFDATCVTGSFRQSWRERWRFHAGLAATWLVLGSLMLSSELGRRGIAADALTWYQYARIECVAVAKYLRLAFWPAPLVFDYGPNLPQPGWRQLILPGVVLVTFAGVSLRELARCRIAGFLGFAILLLLAPTSSVVPVAGQPIAENRMYLSLALVLTAVVAGAFSAHRSTWTPFLAAAIALGSLAHSRNKDFRDEITIWRDTVAKQPTNQRAWVYLSETLRAQGKLNESIDVLLEQLRAGRPAAELENNVAVHLYSAGRITEAVEHFQAAVRLKPTYAEAYYNFGVVLYRAEKFEPALECFRVHTQLNPQSVEGHNYAGLCLFKRGQFAEAIPHFERALAVDPTHPHARANLEFCKAQVQGGR